MKARNYVSSKWTAKAKLFEHTVNKEWLVLTLLFSSKPLQTFINAEAGKFTRLLC